MKCPRVTALLLGAVLGCSSAAPSRPDAGVEDEEDTGTPTGGTGGAPRDARASTTGGATGADAPAGGTSGADAAPPSPDGPAPTTAAPLLSLLAQFTAADVPKQGPMESPPTPRSWTAPELRFRRVD